MQSIVTDLVDPDVSKAIQFAIECHKDIKRKYSGLPYVVHPIRVALMVAQYPGATKAMVMAALLHDVVEDCGVTNRQLGEMFGHPISDMVWRLTNNRKVDSTWDRRSRKQANIDRLAKEPHNVQVIKLFDRLDNVSDLASIPDRNFARVYAEETRLLIQAIGHANPDVAEQILVLCDSIQGGSAS